MNRKKPSQKIKADVMFKSNRECCICKKPKRGDHIHHIDGNSSNNKLENLALLCFKHHNEASISGNISKKLSPQTIIRYREYKYLVVNTKRQNALKVFNSSLGDLSTEDLLIASKNAIIILKLEKIKEEYFRSNWKQRDKVLNKLTKYSNHSNYRVALDVYKFLNLVADGTRSGMTSGISFSILFLVMNYFPDTENIDDNQKIIELAEICIHISFSLVYDMFIYLKDYDIAQYGLLILKFINQVGKRYKLPVITEKVSNIYIELQDAIKRPDRPDLINAQKIITLFYDDVNEGTITLPELPSDIMEVIQLNRPT